MVDEDPPRAGPPPSFFGLGGEQRFRTEIARITAAADGTGAWVAELKTALRRLVPYDACWMGRFDRDADRYQAVLEDGDVEPLRQLFASAGAAGEIRQLGLARHGWPMLGHQIQERLDQQQGWRQHLAPAGFRDGVGLGLRTSDGRHVGYLTLLTYRPAVVPATAAALLHVVNPLIGAAVDRASRG